MSAQERKEMVIILMLSRGTLLEIFFFLICKERLKEVKSDLQRDFAFQPEQGQVVVALRVNVGRIQYQLRYWNVHGISPIAVAAVVVLAKTHHLALTVKKIIANRLISRIYRSFVFFIFLNARWPLAKGKKNI